MERVIAFTGGGTGGHIYPGLAVAEELGKAMPCRLVWIGNETGLDRGIVEAAGVEFVGIPCGKFRRDLSPRNVPDLFRIMKGFFRARAALKKLKPALLFSKGGFVSVPPCYAARSLGIPVFTHDSDCSPGLATRLNARVASRIFLSYESALSGFSGPAREKCLVTGTPVRAAIRAGDAARGRAWLDDCLGRAGPDMASAAAIAAAPSGSRRPLVLFLGGSQGAKQVNELALAADEALNGDKASVDLFVQCGKADFAGRFSTMKATAHGAVVSKTGSLAAQAYLGNEIADLTAAADLVVGRAGANTIWETLALGKPLLLVPLDGAATRGDQVENAAQAVKAGYALSLRGEDAAPGAFVAALSRVLGELSLPGGLSGKARAAGASGAAARMAAEIVGSIAGKTGQENPNNMKERS